MLRALLTDFALKNPYYAAAFVAVYEVNANLQQTATVATLFAGPVGATLRPNPIALDSEGKFPGPVYVEKPVVMVVTTAGGASETLGVSGILVRWRGIWSASTLYYPGERVRDPAGPSTFIVINGHVSNSFLDDLAAGLLEEEIDADSLTDALADDVLGTVIPITPSSAFLRVNAGGSGIEARTAEQVRGDIQATNRGGDTMLGALLLPGFDPVAPNEAARKSYVDARVDLKVSRSGDTMTGPLIIPASDPVSSNEATRKGYVDAAIAAAVASAVVAAVPLASPPGKVAAFGMPSAPTGWLFCDGSAVSRTTYAALFSAIGTWHGAGNGTTTFNLPDYRGVFLRGVDAGRGLNPNRVFASYEDDAFKSHNHSINDPSHAHSTIGVANDGNFGAGGSAGYSSGTTNTAGSNTGITINNSGGAETRPRNVAVYYCIKT